MTAVAFLILCVILAALEFSLARTRNDLRVLRRQAARLAAPQPTDTEETQR